MSIYNRSGTDLIGPYTHGDGGPSPAPRPPATRGMTIIMHSAGRVPKKVETRMARGMEMEVAATGLSAVVRMAMEEQVDEAL